MKLLDTTFLVDLLRGKKKVVKIASSKEVFLTTQINTYEVIRGLFMKEVSSMEITNALKMFNNVSLLSLDDMAIIKSAEISAKLRKSGNHIPNCDCLIAGIALANRIPTIVTKDVEHFKRIKGLKVETY